MRVSRRLASRSDERVAPARALKQIAAIHGNAELHACLVDCLLQRRRRAQPELPLQHGGNLRARDARGGVSWAMGCSFGDGAEGRARRAACGSRASRQPT